MTAPFLIIQEVGGEQNIREEIHPPLPLLKHSQTKGKSENIKSEIDGVEA